MRGAGEEFGSARGGSLLSLCRTLLNHAGTDRKPWSLYVSVDPRFSALRRRMRSASLNQVSLEKPHRPPAVRPSSGFWVRFLTAFKSTHYLDGTRRFFMPLLMKRSCERLQASRNSFEKSRLGELAGSGLRCASIARSSSFCPLGIRSVADFRRRPEETGLVVSFPSQ